MSGREGTSSMKSEDKGKEHWCQRKKAKLGSQDSAGCRKEMMTDRGGEERLINDKDMRENDEQKGMTQDEGRNSFNRVSNKDMARNPWMIESSNTQKNRPGSKIANRDKWLNLENKVKHQENKKEKTSNQLKEFKEVFERQRNALEYSFGPNKEREIPVGTSTSEVTRRSIADDNLKSDGKSTLGRSHNEDFKKKAMLKPGAFLSEPAVAASGSSISSVKKEDEYHVPGALGWFVSVPDSKFNNPYIPILPRLKKPDPKTDPE